MKKIKNDIPVQDYVFNLNKEDLTSAKLEYYFDHYKIFDEPQHNTTKKFKYENIINFEISAKTKDNKMVYFEFTLDASLEELNELPEELTRMTDKIIEGETILTIEDGQSKIIYFDDEKRLYSNPGHFWISKQKENTFFIKISIPEEILFIWFKVELIK